MTRKDKYYRRGLLFLALLFCVQTGLFVYVYSRVKSDRKKIHDSVQVLSASVESMTSAASVASSDSLPSSSPSVSYPYESVIGVGRTKSANGRLFLYKDIRTFYTNGVFSTRRDYIPTPFFKTNALSARVSAREGV